MSNYVTFSKVFELSFTVESLREAYHHCFDKSAYRQRGSQLTISPGSRAEPGQCCIDLQTTPLPTKWRDRYRETDFIGVMLRFSDVTRRFTSC
jgi:hypothetical protein